MDEYSNFSRVMVALQHTLLDLEARAVSMNTGVPIQPLHKWGDQSLVLDFQDIFKRKLRETFNDTAKEETRTATESAAREDRRERPPSDFG